MTGSVRGLITRAEQLDFDPRTTPARPRETGVLMADPRYFAVEYVINPHMAENVGGVDSARARRQWEAVRDAYDALGFAIHVLPAVERLPDLVFTANQSFPTLLEDGGRGAVMSRMTHSERAAEVPLVAGWWQRAGATVLELGANDLRFEGMGDALWLPGHRFVLGGHGFRTDPRIFERLGELLDVPVVCVALVDERFYHLDTCLSLLDPQTALFVPGAFDRQGVALLEKVFPRLVALPENESIELLACNGHCPDERHYLVQSGCDRTVGIVHGLGLDAIELDTSEFLKSGGSVFCMKLMLP